MALSVDLDMARAACAESIDAFVDAAGSLDEYGLLGASRCHGWSRLDVVVHVIAGWQELLGGMVSVVDEEPSVDAASYWSAFAGAHAGDDPVLVLMSQRRRTAAYARPAAALAQLRDLAAMVDRGVAAYQGRQRRWQGHVFAAGDFLAMGAVENVVHQLDMLSDVPAPAGALTLARATIEALAGQPLPAAWTDEDAVLIGTGRAPVPDDAGKIAAQLPALG